MRGNVEMKRILIILFTIFILIIVALGVIIYMKKNFASNQHIVLEINVNNENESFTYDDTSSLDYEKLKYHIFAEVSIERLNDEDAIKYLKEKDNIYYAVYSLKDNKICYIVFKDIDKKLYVDYSWVYSKDMIDAEKILKIETGTNISYSELDSMDSNIIKLDRPSSAYYTVHFFEDGRSAMIKFSPFRIKSGEVAEIIENNNIFNIIYEIDHPERIMQ